MRQIVQTSDEWVTFISDGALYQTFIQNTLISIVLSSIVHLIHTRNYLMTVLIFFAMNLILSSVINIMRFSGWKVGTAEAVCVPIIMSVTTFSYSYLASYYMHAPMEMNKNLKMQYSYQEMGVSVTSGIIVMLVVPIWLLMSDLLIYQKTAIIIISCSVYSYYGAMIFFGAICHCLGPQGGEMHTVPIEQIDEWLLHIGSQISKFWNEKIEPKLQFIQ